MTQMNMSYMPSYADHHGAFSKKRMHLRPIVSIECLRKYLRRQREAQYNYVRINKYFYHRNR